MRPQVGEEALAEEDHPGEAGERPGDEDPDHRQLGELGRLVPAELDEADAVPDEDERHHQDEQVGDDAQQRVGARRELGPEVDVEVRSVADADHRADHDHPDEQEARHLLGPDPRRDEVGMARQDLDRDRNDEDGHRHDQEQVEEPVVAIDELAHGASLCRRRCTRRGAGKKIPAEESPPPELARRPTSR
jgi:hypothetical protein